jgi:hypothetical protein
MSNKDEDLVLRPAETVHGFMGAISTESERQAKIKAYEATIARHGGICSGAQIEMIQDWNLGNGLKTWGWPIYRTYYDDDERWDTFKIRFRALLLETMKGDFPAEEAEERSKYINFPIREDRARFAGASTTQLRDHYLAYLNSNAPFEEQGLPVLTGEPREWFFAISRCCHKFFLIADAMAIASVLDAPEDLPGYLVEETPWINVVQVDWSLVEEQEDECGPDDGYEIVEGLDLFNVGFHRHAVQTLYPSLWQAITTYDLQDWYERPPDVKWEEII